MRGILAFLFFALGGSIAWAQEELHLPEVESPPNFQDGMGVGRFVLAFLLIIVILWAFFLLMRKITGSSMRMSSSKYMQILDFLPVRGNLALYLVQVGERVIMFAHAGNSIQEVAEFQKEELIENPPSQGFSSYLDLLFRRKTYGEKKTN